MAINDLLVVAATDPEWKRILIQELPNTFPSTNIEYTDQWEKVYREAQEKKFDLYLVASTIDRDDFRNRVLDLREIHPEARIALLSGGRYRIEEVCSELDVKLFSKTDSKFAYNIKDAYKD